MAWNDELPAELKVHESLKDIKDLAGLAKAFVDTKAHVGNSLRIPGPDAGEEDRKEFFRKLHEKVPDVRYIPKKDDKEALAALEPELWGLLGKPSELKDYSVEGVDLGGEEAEIDLDALRGQASKLGLTKKQFAEYTKAVADARKAAKAQFAAEVGEAKKAWGAAYQEKLDAISDVALKLEMPEPMVKALKAGQMKFSDLKAWDKVREALGSETREVAKQGQQPSSKLTPAEAKAQIAEIMSNPEYFKGGPRHTHLVKRMQELQEMAMVGD